jgi:hypothetical protein
MEETGVNTTFTTGPVAALFQELITKHGNDFGQLKSGDNTTYAVKYKDLNAYGLDRYIRDVPGADWNTIGNHSDYAVQVKNRKVEAVKCFRNSTEFDMYWNAIGEFAGAKDQIPVGKAKNDRPEPRAAPAYAPQIEEERTMTPVNATVDMIKQGAVDGVKMGLAREAEELLVGALKDLFGDSYPAFFTSPIGKLVEPAAASAIVHYAVTNLPDFPQRDIVLEACELVTKSASYEATRVLAAQFLPKLKDLGAGLASKGFGKPKVA